MSKITKVPNGPLIKKKGPFKGSTLKNGGPIKKAQEGTTLDTLYTKKNRIGNVRTNDYVGRMPSGAIEIGKVTKTSKDGKTTTTKKANQSGILGIKYTDDEIRKSMNEKKNGGPVKKAKAGAMIKRAQNGESFTKDGKEYTYTKQVTKPEGKRTYQGKSTDQLTAMKIANFKIRNNPSDSLTTVKPLVKKNGGLIKRADGSMSKRGLWDNIRANKGSGKKPTKQMLVQEKKIKAKSKK
jgi:hypothetical protein